jgi:hypothetical protein
MVKKLSNSGLAYSFLILSLNSECNIGEFVENCKVFL